MSFGKALERIAIDSFARERGLAYEEAERVWEAERPERERRVRAEEDRRQAVLRADRAADDARRAGEEEQLGRRLGLDVRVRPALAMRLSQLSARSSGNGADRRSRTHLLVLAPFAKGRFARGSGQFLCDTRLAGFDRHLYDVDEPVTCPRCLDLIERHGRKPNGQ